MSHYASKNLQSDRSAPRTSRRSWLLLTAVWLVPVAAGGCRNWKPAKVVHPIPNYFRSPDLASRGVRRVAVFPPLNPAGYPHVQDALANELANSLTSAGCFEAIRVPYPDPCPHIVDWAAIPEELLVHAAKNYRVDAILVGTVAEYRPYWPPRLAVKVHLVDTRDATVLASVDGVWDAGRGNVTQEVGRFACQLTSQETIPHMELVTLAPSIYLQFVAHEIVRRIYDAAEVSSLTALSPADLSASPASFSTPADSAQPNCYPINSGFAD